MQAIYQPRGKAGEYADLAINIFDGCEHGCVYCYVPNMKKWSREEFLSCMPRLYILDAVVRDARRMSGDPRHVLLCFTCDPYPPRDYQPYSYTRETIRILKANKMKVAILTKGASRAMRDFDLLTPEDKFGCTLTFKNPADSKRWEPGADLPSERLYALSVAKARGIQTWASLEPLMHADSALELISLSHPYVDEYKIGRLNYMAESVSWQSFGPRLVSLLNAIDSGYYIKDETMPLMPPGTPQYRAKRGG